jgi:hypothetical protein
VCNVCHFLYVFKVDLLYTTYCNLNMKKGMYVMMVLSTLCEHFLMNDVVLFFAIEDAYAHF